ncbi:O-antigen ligase family protein [Mycobacterium sp. C3-094]
MDVTRAIGRYFSPAVLIIAVWIIRLALRQRTSGSAAMSVRGMLLVTPLSVLMLTSTFLSDERLLIPFAWMAVFTVCIAAPALLGQMCLIDIWPTIRKTFAGISIFLGALSLTDFFFGLNPWTQLFRYEVADNSWSVFRTATSLGHPLTTATVASVGLAVCVFGPGTGRHWPYLIGAGGAVIALLLTVSRASVLAVGSAALVGIFSSRYAGRGFGAIRRGRLASAFVAALFVLALAWSPLLAARNQSADGLDSSAYRSAAFHTALTLFSERPLFGYGPGTSPWAYAHLSSGALENSALQLLISLGFPALGLLVTGLGLIGYLAMRRARAGVAAGLAAFIVAVSGFNAIDSNTALLALIAPLIVCAVAPAVDNNVRRNECPQSVGPGEGSQQTFHVRVE